MDAENNKTRRLTTVNRCAVAVQATEEYIEWARRSPEETTEGELEYLRKEAMVYLITETEYDIEKWLKRNYAAIFENELWGWCTDRELWPEDRSLEAFKRYFSVRFCPEVYDTEKEVIAKGK